MHTSRPVESAAIAAQLIKDGHARDFDALTWTAANGRRLAVVADNHCNNSFLEVAVIDLDRSVQIESITAGWCKTVDELAKYFVKCETTDFLMRSGIELPLDGAKADAKADFAAERDSKAPTKSNANMIRIMDTDSALNASGDITLNRKAERKKENHARTSI